MTGPSAVSPEPVDLDAVRPSLRDLRDQLAETMYDQAHENCDDEGCTGGGKPWYTDLATHFLMPVIASWIDDAPTAADLRQVADDAAQRTHRKWERMANRDAYVLSAMRQVAVDVVVETGVESLVGSKAAVAAELQQARVENVEHRRTIRAYVEATQGEIADDQS